MGELENYKTSLNTTGYASTFALLNGTVGHTIETPEQNEQGMLACVYGGYGAIQYNVEHKIQLATAQLEILVRQHNNIDSLEVDAKLKDENGYNIGRARGANKNFFPDYYVISMDEKNQSDASAAVKMLQLLKDNGVEIQRLTADTAYDGKEYEIGDYIISMKQIKRNLIHEMLSKSIDGSNMPELFTMSISDFPSMWGFSIKEVRESEAFEGKMIKVNSVESLKTTVPDGLGPFVIRNNSNEAVKACNELLSMGKQVKLVTANKGIIVLGDFVVSREDLNIVADHYFLTLIAAPEEIKAVEMKKLKVFVAKPSYEAYEKARWEQTGFVLNQLGFDVVTDPNSADIAVNSVGSACEIFDPTTWVNSGKPYISIGADSATQLMESKVLGDFNFAQDLSAYISEGYPLPCKGVIRAGFNRENSVTASYSEQSLIYSESGSYVTKLPSDSEILIEIINNPDFFVEGWWPDHEKLKGAVMSFKKDNTTVFLNDLTTGAHTEGQYRLLANAIYQH